MKQSHSYNSIVNSLFGIASSFVTVILNFVVRLVLVHELGEEINGLHNLFQSITSVMILMELGISSAMIIHLYEPVKKNDIMLLCGILGFYKRIYIGISVVFTLISIIISLFLLDHLVTTTIPLNVVKIYFLVFTLSFTINYLTYYKRSILYAEQKNRVAIFVTTICELLFRTLQIVSVYYFHNYVIFLVFTVGEKLLSNILCNYYVDKHHPYLKGVYSAPLKKEKKLAIFYTVKPLVVNQTANTVQLSARSLLISILLGNVSIVGYYGNYQLLINIAQMVYAQIGGAFTTSMGSLAVDRDVERMKKAYFKSAFIMNWIASIGCCLFYSCADNFIYLFFGSHFVLDSLSVCILTMNLAVYLLNIPMISMQNALGLHSLDAKNMVFQALIAIAMGYVLGRFYGMPGIFIGLLLPLILFTFIIKGIIIGKKGMQMTCKEYLIFISKELTKILLSIGICYLLFLLLPENTTWWSLVVRILTSISIGIFIPTILSYKSEEFEYVKSLITKIIKR